jgi:hypothetical protein
MVCYLTVLADNSVCHVSFLPIQRNRTVQQVSRKMACAFIHMRIVKCVMIGQDRWGTFFS